MFTIHSFCVRACKISVMNTISGVCAPWLYYFDFPVSIALVLHFSSNISVWVRLYASPMAFIQEAQNILHLKSFKLLSVVMRVSRNHWNPLSSTYRWRNGITESLNSIEHYRVCLFSLCSIVLPDILPSCTSKKILVCSLWSTENNVPVSQITKQHLLFGITSPNFWDKMAERQVGNNLFP